MAAPHVFLLVTLTSTIALGACAGPTAGRSGDDAPDSTPALPVGSGGSTGQGEGEGEGVPGEGERAPAGEGEGEGGGEGEGSLDGEGEGEGEAPPVGEGEGEETDDVTPDPNLGTELNPGWVGGACSTAADCSSDDYTRDATCETTGFPGGFCTQRCTQSPTTNRSICPDTALLDADAEYTVTRCIADEDNEPTCAAECDFDKSETGCRPGYRCVLRERYGSTDIFPICLPTDTQRWPGEPAPLEDIGEPCTSDASCSHLACLALPGGMCTKTMCAWSGCPTGTSCFMLADGVTSACLQDCASDSDCRVAEGYGCDADQTCWAISGEGSGGGSGGGPGGGDSEDDGCASAWGVAGSGLSPCDTVKDSYVVVRKSARTMTLCLEGSAVASFRTGLGFAPVGDKEREGDGKTPEGVFYIPRLVPQSSFYKAFLLSYPDADDAARGRAAGLITSSQRDAIVAAQGACTEPPQTTGLGGLIEIHGNGGSSDWTAGCMAIDNDEVDQLWDVLGVSDTIVVLP